MCAFDPLSLISAHQSLVDAGRGQSAVSAAGRLIHYLSGYFSCSSDQVTIGRIRRTGYRAKESKSKRVKEQLLSPLSPGLGHTGGLYQRYKKLEIL